MINHERILGLDLGTRTLGLAISDPTGTIAQTYQTILFAENDFDILIPILKDIQTKENISTFVLGLPKNMNNTMGERCNVTISFKEKLEKQLSIQVMLQDERLTTIEANRYMLEADISRKKRKNKIDSLAANIILQSYLDKEKGK